MAQKLSAKTKHRLLEAQLFSTATPAPPKKRGHQCHMGKNHDPSKCGFENRPKMFGLEKFDALVEGAPSEEKHYFLVRLKHKLYHEDCYKEMFKQLPPIDKFEVINQFNNHCADLYDNLEHEPCLKSTPEHLNRGGKKVQAQYVQHQAEVYLKRYVQVLKRIRKMKHDKEEKVDQKIDEELLAREKNVMGFFWYTYELNELKRRLPFENDVLEMHTKYLDEVVQISSVQRALKTSKDPEIREALRYLPYLSLIVNEVQIPKERKAKLVLKKPAPVPKTEPPFQTLTKYTEHEFYCSELSAKPELEREYGEARTVMKNMVFAILKDIVELEDQVTQFEEKVKNGEKKPNPDHLMSLHLNRFVKYEALINTNQVIAGCEEKIEQVLEYRKTQMDILKAEFSWLQQIVNDKKITVFPPIFVPEKKEQTSSYEFLRSEISERKQIQCMISIIKLHFNDTALKELADTNEEYRFALETSMNIDGPLTKPCPLDYPGVDDLKELRRQLRAANLEDKTAKK